MNVQVVEFCNIWLTINDYNRITVNTYPWVYTTHMSMEMITTELTTYPWLYTTHKCMEMITTELTTYPWVYKTIRARKRLQKN